MFLCVLACVCECSVAVSLLSYGVACAAVERVEEVVLGKPVCTLDESLARKALLLVGRDDESLGRKALRFVGCAALVPAALFASFTTGVLLCRAEERAVDCVTQVRRLVARVCLKFSRRRSFACSHQR